MSLYMILTYIVYSMLGPTILKFLLYLVSLQGSNITSDSVLIY